LEWLPLLGGEDEKQEVDDPEKNNPNITRQMMIREKQDE
jgi:hypothetical protein